MRCKMRPKISVHTEELWNPIMMHATSDIAIAVILLDSISLRKLTSLFQAIYQKL